jgi:LemA protein
MVDFGKTLLVVIGASALIVLIIVVWFIGTYNSLVSSDQSVNEKWSQVENQYQRRSDLIPNLVETVKGYAAHESKVFTDVTEARSRWASAKTPDEKIQAAGEMESALSRLMVVVENYPQLKASDTFITLQAQLEGTENRVTVARMDYNTVVRDYNVKIKRIPTSIVAGIYGYNDKPFFEAKKGTEEAPKVNFTN